MVKKRLPVQDRNAQRSDDKTKQNEEKIITENRVSNIPGHIVKGIVTVSGAGIKLIEPASHGQNIIVKPNHGPPQDKEIHDDKQHSVDFPGNFKGLGDFHEFWDFLSFFGDGICDDFKSIVHHAEGLL